MKFIRLEISLRDGKLRTSACPKPLGFFSTSAIFTLHFWPSPHGLSTLLFLALNAKRVIFRSRRFLEELEFEYLVVTCGQKPPQSSTVRRWQVFFSKELNSEFTSRAHKKEKEKREDLTL